MNRRDPGTFLSATRRHGLCTALAASMLVALTGSAHAKPEFTDIAYAYHGLLVNRKFKEIKLTPSMVGRFQDSMIDSLTSLPSVGTGGPALDPVFVSEALGGLKFLDDELLLIKSALIQKGIDAALPDEQLAYQWRFDALHQSAMGLLPSTFRNYRPEFENYLTQINLRDILRLIWELARLDTGYNSNCAAQGVPVPPDWPTGGWENPGVLPFRYNFLASGVDTEVWTYQTGEGLCYALPRKNGAVYDALGIICQSKSNGKACFWDNLNAMGETIRTGPGETLRIAELQNGATLRQNCTGCHRGANAFIIHPDTPLGLPTDRDPDERYTPMGQAASPGRPAWENPPAFSAPRAGACSGCHEIAAPSSGYCRILQRAADRTMPIAVPPATDPVPARWDRPNDVFEAHIALLKTVCF